MPQKSTGPYLGPPTWLKTGSEKSLELSPTYPTKATFVMASMTPLLRRGLTVAQASEVTANACGESGWGRHCYWFNAGGWKITKSYADMYTKLYDKDPPWWKARGNVNSGDPDWCFYRAFPDLNTFLNEWCEKFIPKPGTTFSGYRYNATGEAFWGDRSNPNRTWFGEMILAGYKGKPSELRMRALRLVGASDLGHPSVVDHNTITQDVVEIWAQSKLGLDPDGAWGPKSVARCKEFQRVKGQPPTGNPDPGTLLELSRLFSPPPP